MNEHYQIRPFKADDLPRLHEIREAAFRPIFKSFREIVGDKIASVAFASAEGEQARHLDNICKAGSAYKVFILETAEEIICFFSITLDENAGVGEIDLNAVAPDHQNKGVGAMMYDHALKIMKDAGMRVATVGTGGDPSHVPARRAYEKAGFEAAIPSLYLYKAL